MSLFDVQNLIEIKLYYKYSAVMGTKKLFILDDDKAKELLNDPEKGKDVECMTTKWKVVSWKEQNEVMDIASKGVGPGGERQFNFLAYRDAMIKRCLKEWDLTHNQKPVPVTSEAIDSLPGPVVVDLYQKFEKVLDYTEDELKN